MLWVLALLALWAPSRAQGECGDLLDFGSSWVGLTNGVKLDEAKWWLDCNFPEPS